MKVSGKIFCFIGLFFFAEMATAQVWPGDVNNNGVVNNIDLLFMAEALDNPIGPPRPPGQQGIEWEEKTFNPWPNSLSNGVNMAFADCDGDGVVGIGFPPFFSDIDAIEVNYGQTHGTVTPDVFSPGTAGNAPPLFFDQPGFPVFENDIAFFSIHLGSPAQAVDDLAAIAFSIEYDPDIIDGDGVDLFFNPDSVGPPFFSIIAHDADAGRVDVAFANIDSPINGEVELAQFFIVIEDNVMGMTTPEINTTLKIKDVKLISGDMSEQPVFADSIVVTILNDDIINSTSDLEGQKIKIYPQPAHDKFIIDHMDEQVERAELFDLTGRKMRAVPNTGQGRSTTIPVGDLPSGTYLLKVLTGDGWLIEKVFIQ